MSAERIVFLGDSNTFAGGYIHEIETGLLIKNGDCPQLINLGLSSETCSGLSEPAHPFPRPDIHERLERVLAKAQPDLAVACYGVNDAIYHPFSDERFKAFQQGIKKLIQAHAETQTPLILMTPLPFDPQPMQKKGLLRDVDAEEFSWKNIYKNYDSEVMRRYAGWMKTIDDPNCIVVDVHRPLAKALAETRRSDPNFSFSRDGVHIDSAGHRVLAESFAQAIGLGDLPQDNDLRGSVAKRSKIMHLAWLAHVGHLRPGVAAGLPMQKAQAKIKSITRAIDGQLEKHLPKTP